MIEPEGDQAFHVWRPTWFERKLHWTQAEYDEAAHKRVRVRDTTWEGAVEQALAQLNAHAKWYQAMGSRIM